MAIARKREKPELALVATSDTLAEVWYPGSWDP